MKRNRRAVCRGSATPSPMCRTSALAHVLTRLCTRAPTALWLPQPQKRMVLSVGFQWRSFLVEALKSCLLCQGYGGQGSVEARSVHGVVAGAGELGADNAGCTAGGGDATV